MRPAFSLLMPSYNQARYITEAVDSVLAQDDPDWELLILDNSSDDTPARMAAFTDPRIQFIHIPARMDPGTCLNELLAKATGDYFSYIHTDNNLRPDFVRRLRQAMAQAGPLALAYCEQRDIDADGRYIGHSQRGLYDLPRLLSLESLGVPFAATTALARRVGGFSVDSYADDLVFSVSSFGLAEFVHVSAALVDYRRHGDSRTAAAGGYRMIGRFAYDIVQAMPALEARGIPAGAILEQELLDRFAQRDLYVEELWTRRLQRFARPWWSGPARFEPFFQAGFFDPRGRPHPLAIQPGRALAAAGLSRMAGWLIGSRFRRRVRDFRELHRHILSFLIPWACHRLGLTQPAEPVFRVGSADSRTLWAARQLEQEMGWRPCLIPDLELPPAFAAFGWPVATRTDALVLDLHEDRPPRFS